MTDFNRQKKSDRYRDVMPSYKRRKQADIMEIFMDRDNEGRLTQKLTRTEFRIFAEGSVVEGLEQSVTVLEAAANAANLYSGVATQTGTGQPSLTGLTFGYNHSALGNVAMSRYEKGTYDLVFPFNVDLDKMGISISGLQPGSGKYPTTYTLSAVNGNTIRILMGTNVAGTIMTEDNVLKNSMIIVHALPV